MEFLIEVEPINHLNGDPIVVGLYNGKFNVDHILNAQGENRPQKRFGFWETDDAFYQREMNWIKAEKLKLFTGWRGKDLYHFREISNKNTDIFITFETDTINIHNLHTSSYRELPFPETVNNLISYFVDENYPLYWRPEIVDIYGVQNLCSNKEIVDYYLKLKNYT